MLPKLPPPPKLAMLARTCAEPCRLRTAHPLRVSLWPHIVEEIALLKTLTSGATRTAAAANPIE